VVEELDTLELRLHCCVHDQTYVVSGLDVDQYLADSRPNTSDSSLEEAVNQLTLETDLPLELSPAYPGVTMDSPVWSPNTPPTPLSTIEEKDETVEEIAHDLEGIEVTTTARRTVNGSKSTSKKKTKAPRNSLFWDILGAMSMSDREGHIYTPAMLGRKAHSKVSRKKATKVRTVAKTTEDIVKRIPSPSWKEKVKIVYENANSRQHGDMKKARVQQGTLTQHVKHAVSIKFGYIPPAERATSHDLAIASYANHVIDIALGAKKKLDIRQCDRANIVSHAVENVYIHSIAMVRAKLAAETLLKSKYGYRRELMMRGKMRWYNNIHRWWLGTENYFDLRTSDDAAFHIADNFNDVGEGDKPSQFFDQITEAAAFDRQVDECWQKPGDDDEAEAKSEPNVQEFNEVSLLNTLLNPKPFNANPTVGMGLDRGQVDRILKSNEKKKGVKRAKSGKKQTRSTKRRGKPLG
jgi:hypothetical protein